MEHHSFFTGIIHEGRFRLAGSRLLAAAVLAGMALLANGTPAEPARAAGSPLSLSWLAIESGSYGIAWGDVDGDGDLDLAVAGGTANLGLYRNNNGALTTVSVWEPVGTIDASSVAWGDVDGDGDLDLAVGTFSGANRLYLNTGGNLATTSIWSSSETDQTSSLAWGDEDGDGDLDLAVGNRSAPARLYRNTGGTLTASAFWSSSEVSVTESVAWGDVDSDGDLDLAVGNSGSPSRLYRNETNGGTLTTSAVWEAAEPATLGSSLAWGDFDKDGDLDLAAGNSSGPARVYRNDLGTLTTSPMWQSAVTSNNAIVEWGDFDSDGDLDLLTGGRYLVQLYRNNAGVLTTSTVWTLDSADYITDIAWGDVDGDGDLDLASGHGANLPARLYKNASEPLLATAVWSSPITGSTLKPKLAWGDVDGDRDMDLAVGGVGVARMFRNNGGVLSAGPYWSSVDMLGVNFVAWGDVDSDRDLDLLAGATQLRLYSNTGTLATSAAQILTADNTQSMAWGDVDGDGDLDLAVGSVGILPVRLYRNDNGTMTTSAVWSSSESNRGASVEWGDVDGDGDLDLAVGTNGDRTRLYRNDSGTLTSTAVWSSADTDVTSDVVWGDVDGDGDIDLLTVNLGPSRLYRNNNGTLTTTPVWSSVEGGENTSGAFGDADNDGDLDLAVGNLNEPIRVYRNEGGTLTTGAVWRSAEPDLNTYDVAWGDVDRDGDLDLAAGNSSYLRLYRNTRDNRALQNATPTIQITQPNLLSNYYSDPRIWSSPTIPITYTLYDQRGDPVDHVLAWYSPDGGGRWLPAVAASGTVTTNLSTVSAAASSYITAPNFNFNGSGTFTSTKLITSTELIYDMDVILKINIESTSDLIISLISPNGRTVTLVNRRGTGSNFIDTVLDDEAALPISAGNSSFTGSYQPEQVLSLFDELPLAGTWTLSITKAVDYGQVTLVNWEMRVTTNLGRQYTFNWDPIASGFYGQSDNVVFRMRAVPATDNRPNSVPGPFVYNAFASSTTPFRVRGTQVRVTNGISGVPNAVVYRDPANNGNLATPITDISGTPYRTDTQGYLQGRGELQIGDGLVALLPVQTTDTYTRYWTSAPPSPTGLAMHTVSTKGVETLTVSEQNQLVLFNLDVSLQWDARTDTAYLDQLAYNLERASRFLYDWTDGQAALGKITIYHNREKWNDAHLRIYASNHQRPMALQGGIVSALTNDPLVTNVVYMPGQMHLGVVWNRYGEMGVNLADDWPRALAHELGHWALYMNDNYLGVNAAGLVVPVSTCPSIMSDPYREDYPYDELHGDPSWMAECGTTLSQVSVGRSDWATVEAFYPALNGPSANLDVHTGPASLPLDVTQVTWVQPAGLPTTLPDPTFFILQNGQPVQPGATAQAILFQNGWAIDLGGARLDRVTARGAKPGDRLCLYEPDMNRLGCKTIVAQDNQQLTLYPVVWEPEIQLTPISTTTLTVKVNGVAAGLTLKARLYPLTSQALTDLTLSWNGSAYVGTFTSPSADLPLLEGYLQVWVNNDAEPYRREAVVDFAVGGNPARMRGGGARMRGGGSRMRGDGAPLMAANGGVILFLDDSLLGEDDLYMLQAATTLPHANSWTTQAGPAYRLTASGQIAPLEQATLVFNYLSSEVAPGEEGWLKIYFLAEGATTWQILPTVANVNENLVSAKVAGVGVYALMSSIPVSLGDPGWNLFAYPVNENRDLPEALDSIAGKYTVLYGYHGTDNLDPWKMFSPEVPSWVNDLYVLEFGKGYWIYAKEAITLFLKGSSTAQGASTAQGETYSTSSQLGSYPPTTFYGEVLSDEEFIATPDMPVTAWMNGHLCGNTTTREEAGEVVYVVDVLAEDWVSGAGCGSPGERVRFQVDGQWAGEMPIWDNTRAWKVDLSIGTRLFLPVLRR